MFVSSKLVETCESKTDTVEHFLQGLDQSQWLKHVKAVLEASVFISEVIVLLRVEHFHWAGSLQTQIFMC